MNADVVKKQAEILEQAGALSPMALYAGILRGDARELRTCARALAEAEASEIEGAEITNAGILRRGVHIYWPDTGAGRVVRMNGQTGILVEWDDFDPTAEFGPRDPQTWVNVTSGTSLVVIIP